MKLVVILINIRSCYNVGAILRTADGAGAEKIACCGFTPYPRIPGDTRPELLIARNTRDIHKTALDAEGSVECVHFESGESAIEYFSGLGYQIIALENNQANTQNLFEFQPKNKVALVLGSEVDGVANTVLSKCEATLEIPMNGIKNSLNVAVAGGIAIYALLR